MSRLAGFDGLAVSSVQHLVLQGARSKLDVLLLLLAEAPADAWLLWADNDAVFANRAFSFPFRKYEEAGKDVVIGGSEAEVLAGNGHRASVYLRLLGLLCLPVSMASRRSSALQSSTASC